jgi:hypothetical protein
VLAEKMHLKPKDNIVLSRVLSSKLHNIKIGDLLGASNTVLMP